VDTVEADIRKLIGEFPRMPATVIAEGEESCLGMRTMFSP
jgi:hypothetical protein